MAGRRHVSATEPLDAMLEVLLTVYAIQQEPGNMPPLNKLFPKRLQSAYKRARAKDYIIVDRRYRDVCLDDAGCAYLDTHGYRDFVFGTPKKVARI